MNKRISRERGDVTLQIKPADLQSPKLLILTDIIVSFNLFYKGRTIPKYQKLHQFLNPLANSSR